MNSNAKTKNKKEKEKEKAISKLQKLPETDMLECDNCTVA